MYFKLLPHYITSKPAPHNRQLKDIYYLPLKQMNNDGVQCWIISNTNVKKN